MSTEAKILITQQGAKEAQSAIDATAESAKRMGSGVSAAAQKGAEGTDKVKQAANKTTKQINETEIAAKSLLKTFLGFQAAIYMFDRLNAKMQETIRLQEQAAKALDSPLSLGQKMVVQTGTGTQEGWAKQILALQQTAGFASPQAASELLTAMDVEFSSQGGVANEKIMDLTAAIAPDMAAMELSPQQVSALIKFAGTAGVKGDTDSFRKFFAQVQAGFTASESMDMSGFISGLQKGGTAYIAQGGSLESAITNYAGALSVSSNEALSSTLLEQASRIAGGGYEKPRMAIEEAYGVSFADMDIDQRYNALIGYAVSLPENQRLQFLVEAGIPAEVASGFNKLATPGAIRSMNQARKKVVGSGVGFITSQAETHRRSKLYQLNRQKARGDLLKFEASMDVFDEAMIQEEATQWYDDLSIRGDQPLGITRQAAISQRVAQIMANKRGEEPNWLEKGSQSIGWLPIIGDKLSDLESGVIQRLARGRFREYQSPVVINHNYDTTKRQDPRYTQDE